MISFIIKIFTKQNLLHILQINKMLDIKFIIENIDKVKKAAGDKNIKVDLERLMELDKQRVELTQILDALRAERNQNAEVMKQAKGRPDQEVIEKGRKLKEEIQTAEENLDKIIPEYNQLMAMVPMVPSDNTPTGKDESENVEARRWYLKDGGNPPEFDFEIKNHMQLAQNLDLVDFSRGVKVGGFRGYFLKNEATLMHMGLMNLAMKLMVEKGFTPMVTPTIVNEDVLFGSGHFPFDTDNIFTVDSLIHVKKGENAEQNSETRKFLAGTSEPSLLSYHAEEILEEGDLPVKFAGFSPCYRSEVGSYGKDTQGIYRMHEFMKIEQVVICKNSVEEAEKWHKEMIGYAEELLQMLKLPYRLLQICTGDMGAGKYKMYDIETWMPGRGKFGETHSASNLLDWQSRRLNLRIKTRNGNKYYPFTLNNTVVASPRILIAILENYQQKDGSILVPEALQSYVGKEVITPKK